MWFNRSKSSLQALPIFSLVMSISQQIHKFLSIFRGWEGSDTLISNDGWLWMVARRPSTTKWKVIIQTNIWYHWYYIHATLSVMFACHPIWRGHPPSRDPWRHVKTHYIYIYIYIKFIMTSLEDIFCCEILVGLSNANFWHLPCHLMG